MLLITPRVRTLIYEQRGRDAIEQELKRPESGFISMLSNGVRLILEGITSSEEVLRVVTEDV